MKQIGYRYSIESLSHSGSSLYGFTALLSYEELNHTDYAGIYNFWTYTGGRVSFMGIGSEVQSSRVVSATKMVQSGGKAINEF